MKKKIAYLAIGLFLLSWPFGFFMVLRSNAYAEAKNFIQGHPQVALDVGNIQSVAPAWFGSTLKLGSANGPAQIVVNVVGDRETAKIIVDLDTLEGKWKVRRAQLVKANDATVELPLSQ